MSFISLSVSEGESIKATFVNPLRSTNIYSCCDSASTITCKFSSVISIWNINNPLVLISPPRSGTLLRTEVTQ